MDTGKLPRNAEIDPWAPKDVRVIITRYDALLRCRRRSPEEVDDDVCAKVRNFTKLKLQHPSLGLRTVVHYGTLLCHDLCSSIVHLSAVLVQSKHKN
jgi:hypothetical protein